MGHVYVIRAKETDFVKIGYTNTSPLTRLAELQTGCPHILELESVIETTAPKTVETRIHAALKKHHYRGEWYKIPHTEKDIMFSVVVAAKDSKHNEAVKSVLSKVNEIVNRRTDISVKDTLNKYQNEVEFRELNIELELLFFSGICILITASDLGYSRVGDIEVNALAKRLVLLLSGMFTLSNEQIEESADKYKGFLRNVNRANNNLKMQMREVPTTVDDIEINTIVNYLRDYFKDIMGTEYL